MCQAHVYACGKEGRREEDGEGLHDEDSEGPVWRFSVREETADVANDFDFQLNSVECADL